MENPRYDVRDIIIQKQQELINLIAKAEIYDTGKAVSDAAQKIRCDLDGFERWLKKKGLSDNCISSYKTHIKIFFHDYGKMNTETLSQYETQINNDFKPKTVNLKIAAMQKYFKFVGFTDYEFKRAKTQKQTFCDNAINIGQYNKLLKWAKINNIKVYVIAKVIGNTGVRVSELIQLKTKDLYRGYTDIVSKGNKQRRVYFPRQLVDEIKDKCGKEYIVENRYGQQITEGGIGALLRRAGEKAGIPREVMHPHSFRHFFAKQFLKEKNDITLLGDLLGHSDISTTAIYTRLTSEEQRSEMDKLINW